MGWLDALIADIAVALAYVAYAFIFNLAYDRCFPIVGKARATQQRRILAKEAAISGFAGVFEIFDDQLQVLHAVEFVDG